MLLLLRLVWSTLYEDPHWSLRHLFSNLSHLNPSFSNVCGKIFKMQMTFGTLQCAYLASIPFWTHKFCHKERFERPTPHINDRDHNSQLRPDTPDIVPRDVVDVRPLSLSEQVQELFLHSFLFLQSFLSNHLNFLHFIQSIYYMTGFSLEHVSY